jgi:murein DD-endopeptidase MepM/ murein hydrolase activator NlpD
VIVVTARIVPAAYRGPMKRTLVSLVVVLVSVLATAPARASGVWIWPVTGPVVKGFDPPNSPYGSGHRGIDIAAPVGTIVRAPAPGVVSFAGNVGGHLFVTINHGGGLLSTCSFLSGLLVHKGDTVAPGQAIALSGTGHPGDTTPNLHLGVRLNGQYVDPLDYLGAASVVDLIRLAPLLPSAA